MTKGMKLIQAQFSTIQTPGAPLCSPTRVKTRGSPDLEAPTPLARTVRPRRFYLVGYIRSTSVAEDESTELGSYPKST